MPQAICYLGQQRCLYLGNFDGRYRWQHIADSLIVGLDRPFHLNLAGKIQSRQQVAFIPANRAVNLRFNNQAAAFLSSPLWLNNKALFQLNYRAHQIGEVLVQRHAEDALLESLYRFNTPGDATVAGAGLQNLLNPKQIEPQPIFLDARIQWLIQRVVRDPASTEVLAHYITDLPYAGSYLSRLFREQTGLSFARFRLGMRVLHFIHQFSRYRNLTVAAHAAEFSDLAHLNKCHRLLFGISPSRLWLPAPRLLIRQAA